MHKLEELSKCLPKLIDKNMYYDKCRFNVYIEDNAV
jgi:hypothetical protein